MADKDKDKVCVCVCVREEGRETVCVSGGGRWGGETVYVWRGEGVNRGTGGGGGGGGTV